MDSEEIKKLKKLKEKQVKSGEIVKK